MKILITCLILVGLLTNGTAQEVSVQTIVEGLNNPCGVTVQPGTDQVYVAESGALRIVRIVEDSLEPVVTGFPKDVYGPGPKFEIGPLGLVFVDQESLIVGGGGNPDGKDILRIYEIPQKGEPAIAADKISGTPQVLAADESQKLVGEGNFYGVAIFEESVYTTCNGDDEKGWLGCADIIEGKLLNFRRAVATKEKTGVDAPVAIATSPEGYIAVSQMGEISVPGDSLLTFYDASGEELVNWKFETGLNDITALAYGPKRGRLFAADFSWSNPKKGALYKLMADSKSNCKAIKIVDLDKPTAMAFDPDGNLYITLLGTAKEGDKSPPGKLIKVVGLDDNPE